MQLLQIGFLRFDEVIPHALHWGLFYSRCQGFWNDNQDSEVLHTLIIANSAADIPGLQDLHFPHALAFSSRWRKSFLQNGQLGIVVVNNYCHPNIESHDMYHVHHHSFIAMWCIHFQESILDHTFVVGCIKRWGDTNHKIHARHSQCWDPLFLMYHMLLVHAETTLLQQTPESCPHPWPPSTRVWRSGLVPVFTLLEEGPGPEPVNIFQYFTKNQTGPYRTSLH